jgi:hypothetical protein
LYDFDIVQLDDVTTEIVLGRTEWPVWQVNSKNNSGDDLYITVLNLTEGYGVESIIPSQPGDSELVRRGENCANCCVQFTVPELLMLSGGESPTSNKDVFVFFVSYIPLSFKHVLLDDLVPSGDVAESKARP